MAYSRCTMLPKRGYFLKSPGGNPAPLIALLAASSGYAEQPRTTQLVSTAPAAAPAVAEEPTHAEKDAPPEAATHSAEAAPHAPSSGEHGTLGHHRFHLGTLGSAHVALVAGDVFATLGGGLLLAWIAVPSRLELEVVWSEAATEGGVVCTQDLLLKFPLPLSRRIHPFIELGPTAAQYFVGPETPGASNRTGWGIGGGVGAGADVWLTRHVALIGVLDYGLLYRQLSAVGVVSARVSHEPGGSLGVLVGL